VSPSWRERVRIAIAPHRVALVRFGRGLRPRVRDRKLLPCAAESGNGWAGALESLREALAHPNVSRADATVILSNHFVRYLALPWSTQLVTEREQIEFARARLVQIHGEAAAGWSLRLSPAPAGRARLCAAMDDAPLDALRAAISASPLKLVSVQPALMAQFNAARGRIGDDAWLAIAERGRLLMAWIAGGEWRSVRSRPLNGEAVRLGAVLEQERLLLSAQARSARVLLGVLDDVAVDTEGVRVERLDANGRAGRLPQIDAGFALAMTGAA
jgi:hypothetical protein